MRMQNANVKCSMMYIHYRGSDCSSSEAAHVYEINISIPVFREETYSNNSKVMKAK